MMELPSVARGVSATYCRTMKLVVLGSLGMVACWSSGGSKSASGPSSSDREIAVAAHEIVEGNGNSNELARAQAIEQARAAGILGPAPERPPPPMPEGPLDEASIRRAIGTHRKAIRLCYERRLSNDESLHGTTSLTFVIGPDGGVSAATAAGFDAAIDACLADAIKRIRFPAPADGGTMRVKYPFAFKPADSDDEP
jgi:hypothetical protein